MQVTFVLLIALTYFPLRTEGVGLDDKLKRGLSARPKGKALKPSVTKKIISIVCNRIQKN